MLLKRLAVGTALVAMIALVSPARAVDLPATPQPQGCTVQPITTSALIEIVGAGASPAAAASPVALSDNITAAVQATVIESIACTNANQPLRALALFTDRYLANRFSGAAADDLGHLIAAATRSPAAAAPEDRLSLISITDLKALPDGRVSATVTTANAQGSFVDVLTFANSGGRWLIDGDAQVSGPGLATPTIQG